MRRRSGGRIGRSSQPGARQMAARPHGHRQSGGQAVNAPGPVGDLEVYLIVEVVKIVIFLAQLIVIFVLISRLRDVRDGLDEVRAALVDVRDDLKKGDS